MQLRAKLAKKYGFTCLYIKIEAHSTMTIAEIEEIFLEQMPGFYEKEEIKSIASMAVQHVCGFNKSYYLLHKMADLKPSQETDLIRILDELRFGKPLQYVLGEADFYGLKFKVNNAVLIPRPETEELVDWILASIKSDNILSDYILDIGTGSGCIPIALKKNLPFSEVFAIDISNEALETARKNCLINEVEINLMYGDILDNQLKIANSKSKNPRFNIIVSNPPYITLAEKETMQANVLQHEPYEALFVPDANPLVFYRSIVDFALANLSKNGHLFFEINEQFGPEVVSLLQQNGFKAELKKDLQGKDRMIKACKEVEN